MNRLRRTLNNLPAYLLQGKNTKVVVLGHQKSGTTAIGSLLATSSGLTYSNDPLYNLDNGQGRYYQKMLKTPQEFGKNLFWKSNFLYKQVVKDPDFIFAPEVVFRLYPSATYLFIVRNPYQVIRSIFNRLKIEGTTEQISITKEEMFNGNRHWELILNGEDPGDGQTILSRLAKRIECCTSHYHANKPSFLLLVYEEFLDAKQGFIDNLRDRLDLPKKADINHLLDKQFQPKGKQHVDLEIFFGEANMQVISKMCEQTLTQFGY